MAPSTGAKIPDHRFAVCRAALHQDGANGVVFLDLEGDLGADIQQVFGKPGRLGEHCRRVFIDVLAGEPLKTEKEAEREGQRQPSHQRHHQPEMAEEEGVAGFAAAGRMVHIGLSPLSYTGVFSGVHSSLFYTFFASSATKIHNFLSQSGFFMEHMTRKCSLCENLQAGKTQYLQKFRQFLVVF